jgi:hypothetical protein
MAKKQVAKVQAYQTFFELPEGQIILEDLMRTHYINRSTIFDGDFSKAVLREGERNVVLRILEILKMDVKAIQERIKSHENDV